MDVTRRQFVCLWGAVSIAWGGVAAVIVERRVYDRAGVAPPEAALRRCGMERVERHHQGSHVALLIGFDSLAERTRAWDRFNSDPEWCALRDGGDVRLREISFGGPQPA